MSIEFSAYLGGVDCVRCLIRDLDLEITSEDERGVKHGRSSPDTRISLRKHDKAPPGERQHFVYDAYGVDFDWFLTFYPDKELPAASKQVLAQLPAIYEATSGDAFVTFVDTPVIQWARGDIRVNLKYSRHELVAEAFEQRGLGSLVTVEEILQK